jgi:hypothetical protein
MTSEKPTPSTPSDDIDLVGLLERVYLFFRRFRNTFIIAIIAGIALGCTLYFLSPKQYQSKLILHSSYLTNQEQIEIIGYWNELLKRGEHKELSPILNCNEDLLNNIVSLEGVEIQKNYSSTDPNGFYVNAKVKSNSVLKELQDAIVYGLNNTEYVKKKLAARKGDLQELIDKTTVEISKLDSVKKDIENIISNKEKTSSSLFIDVSGVNKDLVDLNEKLITYKNELRFISSVQVLQGFIPLDTPVSMSLKATIAIALILCIVVAYLFSLLKHVEDRLRKRVKANA